jgi:hypothetical protein
MQFQTMYCRGIVHQRQIGHYDLIIEGTLNDEIAGRLYYIASAGADRRASYTGSGLPFANQIQAFENTPNIGNVELGPGNSFRIPLVTPNSYMSGLGTVQIPPTLYLNYQRPNGENRTVAIKVADPIPYRSMTYPTEPRARIDATFYDSQFDLVPKTQEQILYDSAYPCNHKTHPNFWGLKPPL